MIRVALLCLLLIACVPALAGAAARPPAPSGGLVEVVVTLDTPPLARMAPKTGFRTLASVSYERELTETQQMLEERIQDEISGAAVQRRYSVVVDGLAVTLQKSQLAQLENTDGVAHVYPSVAYRRLGSARSASPGFIGAPALWGRRLATAGRGIKIGIIDDGIDRRHPYFNPRGYKMPKGFPKGQKAFTSAKVIVARAFPPKSPKWRYASRPFDPLYSEHATHVAGIAAGNYRTKALRQRISGVAPRAYLGNYKVLTIPTPGFGLNGNSPEIVAAIEAAVRDGMDVINLSLGEAEIDPQRDIVARALDAAAAAGVVPVVAAGNDYSDLGAGSITSPGTSARSITVAAETQSGPTIAGFSSAGPTPLSMRLKPDVSAPGVSVLSSVPAREGVWEYFSGTSMAAPHVAGAAALLRQRHPRWTVEQLKSALVQTGQPVFVGPPRSEADTTRQGGGTVALRRANRPLLFASPTGLSFGLVAPGTSAVLQVSLTDAGGGAGSWSVTVSPLRPSGDSAVTAAPTTAVPGSLAVTATAVPSAPQVEHTGFITLDRGTDRRRIPYWFRVAAPALGAAQVTPLTRSGTYAGDTRGHPNLVTSYRYPEDPRELGIPRFLLGPEQVFRVTLTKGVANFGVAVTGGASQVEPRIVRAGNENALLGEIALPYNANPYLHGFGTPSRSAGAALPGPGAYDVVFDSTTEAGAGPFTFRFWIGDATPPKLRVLSTGGGVIRISARDAGSGVDPALIRVFVDGRLRTARFDAARELVTAPVGKLRRGRHRLRVVASDYQESKNMENVRRILPNTARLSTVFRVR